MTSKAGVSSPKSWNEQECENGFSLMLWEMRFGVCAGMALDKWNSP